MSTTRVRTMTVGEEEFSGDMQMHKHHHKEGCHGGWAWVFWFIVIWVIASIVFIIWNPTLVQNKDANGQPNGTNNIGYSIFAGFIVTVILCIFAWLVMWFGCGDRRY